MRLVAEAPGNEKLTSRVDKQVEKVAKAFALINLKAIDGLAGITYRQGVLCQRLKLSVDASCCFATRLNCLAHYLPSTLCSV